MLIGTKEETKQIDQLQSAREINNVSSHTIAMIDTQIISTVLQKVTGDTQAYALAPNFLTPY